MNRTQGRLFGVIATVSILSFISGVFSWATKWYVTSQLDSVVGFKYVTFIVLASASNIPLNTLQVLYTVELSKKLTKIPQVVQYTLFTFGHVLFVLPFFIYYSGNFAEEFGGRGVEVSIIPSLTLMWLGSGFLISLSSILHSRHQYFGCELAGLAGTLSRFLLIVGAGFIATGILLRVDYLLVVSLLINLLVLFWVLPTRSRSLFYTGLFSLSASALLEYYRFVYRNWVSIVSLLAMGVLYTADVFIISRSNIPNLAVMDYYIASALGKILLIVPSASNQLVLSIAAKSSLRRGPGAGKLTLFTLLTVIGAAFIYYGTLRSIGSEVIGFFYGEARAQNITRYVYWVMIAYLPYAILSVYESLLVGQTRAFVAVPAAASIALYAIVYDGTSIQPEAVCTAICVSILSSVFVAYFILRNGNSWRKALANYSSSSSSSK